MVHPKDLLNFLKNDSDQILPVGIPKDVTPAYSLRNFDFFITSENQPQLKITAKKSNFYSEEALVHARESTVTLQNGAIVDSKEILYNAPKAEVRFFGEVVISMPDGAVIRTDYMKANLRPFLTLFIPKENAISGLREDSGGRIEFKAFGLTYSDQADKVVQLSSKVELKIRDTQQIQSDLASLNFRANRLNFKMDEQKNFDRQFVQVHQTNLEMKSRVLEVQLKGSALEKISALNDVTIREKSFYSTCGKAVFHERQNKIELSEFPQVYQQSDTITGDLIIYSRNDDSIEVKQSNAIYKH